MQLSELIMAPIIKLMSSINLTKKFTLVILIVLLGYIPTTSYVYLDVTKMLKTNRDEALGVQYLQHLERVYVNLLQAYNSYDERVTLIANAQKELEELHTISQQPSAISINSDVEELLTDLSTLAENNNADQYRAKIDEYVNNIAKIRSKITNDTQLLADPTRTSYLMNAIIIQTPPLMKNYMRYAYFNQIANTPASDTIQPVKAAQQSSDIPAAQIEQIISASKIKDLTARVEDNFKNLTDFAPEAKNYINQERSILTTINEGIKHSMASHQRDKGTAANLRSLASALSEGQTLALHLIDKKNAHYTRVVWLLGISFFAALFLVLYCIAGFMRSIKNPIADLINSIKLIASGNLVSEIPTYGKDEFNSILTQLSEMQKDLFSVVDQINGVSSTLNSSAQEIASSNGNLSERTQEQASCLVETAASLNNLTNTIKKNAESARDAAEQSNNATLVAQKGGQAVDLVITTMTGINASAQKIQEITGVIDGIAFQTNLLALNASVEAARAGEQGRGFAVVASEVRNLAQRSAEAAKQIKGLINDSMAEVASGDAQVKVTSATMKEVVEAIESVNAIIGKIAIASNEQSSSIEEINIVISQLEANTQKNAAQVEEVAASTELLHEQSGKLVTIVHKFEIDDERD